MVGSCRVMKKSNVRQRVGRVTIDLCGTNSNFRFAIQAMVPRAQRATITSVVSGHLQWLNGILVHGQLKF